MFSRKSLGIEIYHDGAKIALVEGRQDNPLLAAFGSASFPAGTVRLSLRDLNVVNPTAFVATIREMYLKLLTNVSRVSVSLPDSVGRVILMDVETRFKSRDEGADIIRWKLKKNFPFDISDAHLDFQQIQEKETGEVALLVSLIARPVITQYEDLLVEAGVQPNRIDFTTFNIYSLFHRRLELAENSIIISCCGGIVSVLIYYCGVLEFYRAKEMSDSALDANRIYRELNSSLLVYQDKFPGHAPGEAFCIYAGDDVEAFCAVIVEATGLEPVLLDPERVVTRSNGLIIDKRELRQLTAAVGAAARNL